MSGSAALQLLAGLALLLAGGYVLVRGASALARAAGVSPLVVGLTVVAFGTSAPELAVSLSAALGGLEDITVGNVVGSNIFNVLFILGVSALATPLVVAQRLVRIDVPLMIGLSLALCALGLDGVISRAEGGLFVAALAGYLFYSARSARGEPTDVRDEYVREFGGRTRGGSSRMLFQAALVVGGLLLLILGSTWFVDGASAVARALGLSELVIGLTIVAVGTSLPEVVTSLLAALKGERDIAVGNVIGSNIFNIVGVLGLTTVVAPDGVPVASAALGFDLPVMVATSVACLPIFVTGHRIERWEGAVFLGYYVAYVGFLVLDASSHDALPLVSTLMLLFIMPLTVITLAVVLAREMRAARRSGP